MLRVNIPCDCRHPTDRRWKNCTVTKALLDAGVEDVVLNVRADNMPALRCYSCLGYTTVRPDLEARAVERSSSSGKLAT